MKRRGPHEAIACKREGTQTPRQNLLKVLSGGSPAWMPVCVHVTNANNLPGFLPSVLLDPPLDYLEISSFIGGDLLYETAGVHMNPSEGVAVQSATEGDIRVTTLTTPEGSIEQTTRFTRADSPVYDDIPEGFAVPGPVVTSNHTTYFITDPRDYAVLTAYADAQTFSTDLSRMKRDIERVGDRGLCLLGGGPPSPLYAMISTYAGIERFAYDLYDAPQAIETAMDALQRAACRWYEAAAATPCEAIRCTEDLDTKLVSPDMFRRYAAPALKQYADICHAHGKLFIVHMCGHIRDLLPDIRATGADAIHCLTMPPTGNTTVEAAREHLALATAAMVRVDPHLMLRGDDAALDAFAVRTCRAIGDWHNVLLIIPCGRASPRSVRRVIERIGEYGNWRR